MASGYYRYPTICQDRIAFISEDDIWEVPATGGTARRLTSNLGHITYPFYSPDGSQLAFVGREEGYPEVYVMPAQGGPAQRLTYQSSDCRVIGWSDDSQRILYTSYFGQAHTSNYVIYSLPADGSGPAEVLPFGPARAIGYGPDGAVVLGRNTGDPARWKRYRGGTAGHLWIDANGDGDFAPFLNDIEGNIASPMWLPGQNDQSGRIYFISDHEGIGNLYSVDPDGTDIQRHTDHEGYYARNPSTDGRRIVYHVGADLHLFDPATGESTQVEIDYFSPRVQRNRKFSSAAHYLDSAGIHPTGQALTITTRGRAFAFYNHEGPVIQVGKLQGVRYRLADWLNDGRRIVVISDESGEERLEIYGGDVNMERTSLDEIDFGRAIDLRVSPTEDKIALTNHRHELLIIDLSPKEPAGKDVAEKNLDEKNLDEKNLGEENAPEKESVDKESVDKKSSDQEVFEAAVTVVDRSPHRRIAGFDWSPDGRWLVYGFGATQQTSELRLYRLAEPDAEDEALHTAATHRITRPVLHDVRPSFDPQGRFIYFISYREFNPVYDGLHFDLGFPLGAKPYLLTLREGIPNPFIPRPQGDSRDDEDEDDEDDDGDEDEIDDDGEYDGDLEEDDEEDDGYDELDEDGDWDEDDEGDWEEESMPAGQRALTLARHRQGAIAHARRTDQPDEEPESEEPVADILPEMDEQSDKDNASNDKPAKEDEKKKPRKPRRLRIDLEDIERRVLPFPVSEGRYGQIEGVPNKALFNLFAVQGSLDGGEDEEEESPNSLLQAYNFKEYRVETLAEDVEWFDLSRNRKKLLYGRGRRLRVISAGEKAPSSSGGPRKSGWIDLSRVKLSIDPQSEWEQMLGEAWRLQRDQFWSEDMSDVDWQEVYQRYLPLIRRVSSRTEFSDLMWEMQGELGTSHAYEFGGDYRPRPVYLQGFLGADATWDPAAEGYRLTNFVQGDAWSSHAHSPLAAPGVRVKEGDVLIAINGQRLSEDVTPDHLLVNQAGEEVHLTLLKEEEGAGAEENPIETGETGETGSPSEPPSSVLRPPSPEEATEGSKETEGTEKTGLDADARSSVVGRQSSQEEASDADRRSSPYRFATVLTLRSERRARYRAWVNQNRAYVHKATDAQVGYVHIPDMGANGYAEFHRGYLAEVEKDALIVDVRYNGGGHVSPLIIEKLARRRLGFEKQRWGGLSPFPAEAVGGPIVALTNEHAGSDGDIFCHSFKLLDLGPLVGKRTWGGVVGIWPRHALVDGTVTTQPEFSFWFEDVGWDVENYGTDPDIEVDNTPQDYREDRDAQLDRAIEEILGLLKTNPPLQPPDPKSRPSRALPTLPPRK